MLRAAEDKISKRRQRERFNAMMAKKLEEQKDGESYDLDHDAIEVLNSFSEADMDNTRKVNTISDIQSE